MDVTDDIPTTSDRSVPNDIDAATSSAAQCSEFAQEEHGVKVVGSTVVVTGIPVVTMTDPSKVPSPNGTFPFSRERLSEKCRWKFDEWYPRCCLACSLNGLYPIQESPSGSATIAVPEDITSPAAEEGNISVAKEDVFETDENDDIQLSDLPDHVLLRIFHFLHPIDRVRSASTVCKRWNRLSKSRKLWREVRIIVSDPPYYRKSVTEFLHQVGRYIEKICIHISCSEPFTEREFIGLFPSLMPAVTVLDIGFFSNLTISILNFFMECFPNLERLNMEGLKKVDKSALVVLCSQGFPKLKELILSHCEALSVAEYEVLCSVKRPLEVLSIDGIPALYNFAAIRLATAPFALSLKRLYLDGEELYDTGFRALTCCKNLTLLSVSFCESCSDTALDYIKMLSKLEHLHLRKGKEFTEEGFKRLFRWSMGEGDSKSEFPSRLRFLNLGECPGVNDVVVNLITQNCPGLRSLCLVWCWSVTDIGFTMIVQRLHDLEFLDIRGMDCINGIALLDVPDLYLKKLRYIGAEQCPRIEDSTLQILNLRKKDLIVTNYDNYFVTFTLTDGDAVFGERFDVEFQDTVNDELSRYDGFCCMSDMR